MLDVSCPSCGEVYHVAQEHAGRSLRCRKCNTVFEATVALGHSEVAGGSGTQTGGQSGASSASTVHATGPGKPVTVTDQDFGTHVIQSAVPVLVDFWAPWCPPCRAIAPALEQLAGEYAGRATVAKLNTDENPSTMTRYGVMGLPTLLIFKDGKEVDRLVGAHPTANIKRALDKVA